MSIFGAAWICGSSAGLCFKHPTTSTANFASVDLKDLIRRNQAIEQQIEQDRLNAKKTLKILLLGAFIPPNCPVNTYFRWSGVG